MQGLTGVTVVKAIVPAERFGYGTLHTSFVVNAGTAILQALHLSFVLDWYVHWKIEKYGSR